MGKSLKTLFVSIPFLFAMYLLPDKAYEILGVWALVVVLGLL